MGGAALILIILAFVIFWTCRRGRRRHREAHRQEVVHPFSESTQILTYLRKLKGIQADWQLPTVHPKAGIQPLQQLKVDPYGRSAGGIWQTPIFEEASPTYPSRALQVGTITLSWGPGVSPSSPRNTNPPSYTPF